MRLIVSGGGTGGHVYPALAAVQSLHQHCTDTGTALDILWLGSSGGMEEALVKRAGLEITLIAAAALRGKNPLAALKSVGLLSRGYFQSLKILRRFGPDVVFVTGGYVCVPVTLAARWLGIPVIIYLPDIEPGLAIKFLAQFASRIAVTASESQQYFKPGLSVVTGYPLKPELAAPIITKAQARQTLGLENDQPVLLVFGGSRGARSINRAITGQIEAYLKVCQVLHISGTLDAEWVQACRAELSPPQQTRYHVWPYLHQEMTAALLAADLVVARAGASVMGEFPAVGLPAILVPLPISGGHQWPNANYLARSGAAQIIDDADLNQQLKDTVLNIITKPQTLDTMRAASKKLAQPQASLRLAHAVMEVIPHGT